MLAALIRGVEKYIGATTGNAWASVAKYMNKKLDLSPDDEQFFTANTAYTKFANACSMRAPIGEL